MTKKQLEESSLYLRNKGFESPEIGIILGTGLGRLVDHIESGVVAHYHNIPFSRWLPLNFIAVSLFMAHLKIKK